MRARSPLLWILLTLLIPGLSGCSAASPRRAPPPRSGEAYRIQLESPERVRRGEPFPVRFALEVLPPFRLTLEYPIVLELGLTGEVPVTLRGPQFQRHVAGGMSAGTRLVGGRTGPTELQASTRLSLCTESRCEIVTVEAKRELTIE